MTKGFHATPTKKAAKVREEGLRRQPFWRSLDPIRFPLRFKFSYVPKANVVSGKPATKIMEAVYDSLKAANKHLTLNSQTRFNPAKLSFFLVDLQNAKILSQREKVFFVRMKRRKKSAVRGNQIDEVALESPPQSLKEITFAPEELQRLEQKMAALPWFESNMLLAEEITKKILGQSTATA